MVVFRDIRPAAEHHYLICPREHIPNAKSLTSLHIPFGTVICYTFLVKGFSNSPWYSCLLYLLVQGFSLPFRELMGEFISGTFGTVICYTFWYKVSLIPLAIVVCYTCLFKVSLCPLVQVIGELFLVLFGTVICYTF